MSSTSGPSGPPQKIKLCPGFPTGGGGGGGGPSPAPVVVVVPNRPKIITGQALVTVPPGPTTLPSIAIPDGFPLVVKAMPGNKGRITLGGDKGAAAHAGTTFFSLQPGEPAKFFVTNANAVSFDAFNAGDGVEYAVEQ